MQNDQVAVGKEYYNEGFTPNAAAKTIQNEHGAVTAVKGRQNSVIQPKKAHLSLGHKSSKELSELMDEPMLVEEGKREEEEKDYNGFEMEREKTLKAPVQQMLEPKLEL